MSPPVTCECGACKVCERREYYRAWRIANAESYKEYHREYSIRNAEKIRARARAWREENEERAKESKRLYYQANKDRIREERRTKLSAERSAQAVAWNRRNPEKRRAIALRDKMKRRGAPLTALGAEYTGVLLRDPCAYCGAPALTVDHIVPISRGGDSDWENLTPACKSCNSRKHARPLLPFLLGQA